MVTVRDITLTSTCEHHFVTIDGKATVAYILKDLVIGLSKINRIVQFFAPASGGAGTSDAANSYCATNATGHQ